VIDEFVPDPLGGALRGAAENIQAIGDAIELALGQLGQENGDSLRRLRREKFLEMGKRSLG
jgi:acetyl-CoA carboxylase carboxyl transferase subunit alpha